MHDTEKGHGSQCSPSQWNSDSESAAQIKPPTDGGRDAWLVLTASFILGAIVWGEYTFLNPKATFNIEQAFSTASVSSKNTMFDKRSFLDLCPASLL
jgi:hypothetical protein